MFTALRHTKLTFFQGAIVSAIGGAIEAVISAIASVLMIIVSTIVTVCRYLFRKQLFGLIKNYRSLSRYSISFTTSFAATALAVANDVPVHTVTALAVEEGEAPRHTKHEMSLLDAYTSS